MPSQLGKMRAASTLHVTIAEQLYPVELGVLHDALAAPPYTALLTGGDAAILRALVDAVLPGATITSCPAEKPAGCHKNQLSSFEGPLIVHGAHCNVGALLRAVLDGEHVQSGFYRTFNGGCASSAMKTASATQTSHIASTSSQLCE